MEDKLLQILNHFGIENQQRKLQEELFELNEAITIHELKSSVEYEIPLTEIVGTKDHIKEEFADMMVLLSQIGLYYGINPEEIDKIGQEKVNRTIDRISSGYYK